MGDSVIREPADRRVKPPYGRAAVLRLASWFDQADAATAHRLFTAAFSLYPARHLSGSTEETIAVAASWWDVPPADTSAVRPARGGALAPAEDHSAQQVRLRDTAEAAAHWRRSAAEEVRSRLAELTPRTGRITLSQAALGVLVELLTRALGSGDATAAPVSAGDLELDIRLHVRHDADAVLVLSEDGGDLTLTGLRLCATPYARTEPEHGSDAVADTDTEPHTPVPAMSGSDDADNLAV
ncbi:hypothetical protein TM51_13760 [Thermobifida fusca TM51]|uniref:Uncharacterized protein n=1 Tax=Thermobifida fusca TM51 TaxID=1169414 RepID=A0A9P2T794_THEFU|nr:hypothetical protein TM51_13760 [Thermobifida fusca TM51]